MNSVSYYQRLRLRKFRFAAVLDAAEIAAEKRGDALCLLQNVSYKIAGEGTLFRLAFLGAGSHRQGEHQKERLCETLIWVHPRIKSSAGFFRRSFCRTFTQKREDPVFTPSVRREIMKIISIQGPWSVGKSTLIRRLGDIPRLNAFTMKEFGDDERSVRDNMNLNLSLKAEFLENQKIFFLGEHLRYEKIRKLQSDYLILDRGPEDTLCFTEIHPKAINASWEIETESAELKYKYIHYKSDCIIYLDASLDAVLNRRNLDNTKNRKNFEQYMNLYYKLEKDYFLGNDKCRYIDTTNQTAQEVLSHVLNLIDTLP